MRSLVFFPTRYFVRHLEVLNDFCSYGNELGETAELNTLMQFQMHDFRPCKTILSRIVK